MSDSTKGKKKSFRKIKCRSCSGPLSPLDFDVHSTCHRCRLCSREEPCGICSGWSAVEWKSFTAWQDSMSRPSSGPTRLAPVVSSFTANVSHNVSSSSGPSVVRLSDVISSASENVVISSYERPIPASSEQPSIFHQRTPDDVRDFPPRTAGYNVPSWSHFPHDPRQAGPNYPPLHPQYNLMASSGDYFTRYPQDSANFGGHFSQPRERYTHVCPGKYSRSEDRPRHVSSSGHGSRSTHHDRNHTEHCSTEVLQRSTRDYSRSRSRSPIRVCSGSPSSRSVSPNGRYSRHRSGHASPSSSFDSDLDCGEPEFTSMFHRGKLVVPEVGKILQFPPPSPKESSRRSFRREATQSAPPPKFTVPVDSFLF